MNAALGVVLILLAASVLTAALFRRFRLPTMLGYLLVGMVLGPHALRIVPAYGAIHSLAEFGVVFLMFSIGLEFSLPQLNAMRRLVLGFGGLLVLTTFAAVFGLAGLLGLDWKSGFLLGGVIAMSSTAIVSKMLADRVELQTPHGQYTISALLFQDLAVVPLLVLVPALAAPPEALMTAVAWGLVKTAIVLVILLALGQRLMRPWFTLVANFKSPELFMLNVLLVTLSLAYLTAEAGLSLALGAFVAGVLISETDYRYQVESDIQPFRDVFLGLFFVTIGMLLDFRVVADHAWAVILLFVALVVGKAALAVFLARRFGTGKADSVRTGLALAQAGEFGFVLLAQASEQRLLAPEVSQVTLAAMLLSMLLAPFLIHFSEPIARFFSRSEWESRAQALHKIALGGFGIESHVIVCGYGRSGQNLARLLEREDIAFIALDLDPARVRQAAAAGDNVVYGDASRREVLMAAGIKRARALIVTYADTESALRVLQQVHQLAQGVPVIVRTRDDSDFEKLVSAGAAEVVPEVMEGSLMLASHALMLVGVPLARVVRSIREIREQRYTLLRAFFHGVSDAEMREAERFQPRLHTVTLAHGAYAIGKQLGELHFDTLQVRVTAIRRHNIRGLDPQPETRFERGDTVVLVGAPEGLEAAERRLQYG